MIHGTITGTTDRDLEKGEKKTRKETASRTSP